MLGGTLAAEVDDADEIDVRAGAVRIERERHGARLVLEIGIGVHDHGVVALGVEGDGTAIHISAADGVGSAQNGCAGENSKQGRGPKAR